MQADYPGAAEPPDSPVHMTDAEAIAAVKAGGRCRTQHCLWQGSGEANRRVRLRDGCHRMQSMRRAKNMQL